MNNIGQRIKEHRKKADLTQEALADYLGVTYKAVSKWECGVTVPDVALIMPLAKILNVSADELLSGKPEEIDARRAEFDKFYEDHLKHTPDENYQTALKAVREYPMDYKYLSWLAECERSAAYSPKYKTDSEAQYSAEMMEQAIKHSNRVIDECNDPRIRGNAIWNAVLCCKALDRYDEALKYANMLPNEVHHLTRNSALDLCLQGEKLIEHRKFQVRCKLYDLFISLSRIYWFETQNEPYVTEALDATEALLKTAIPDGNYLGFHKVLCCVYQVRAQFALKVGNSDKAMEYLKIMLEHAKKIPCGTQDYTSGVLEGLSEFTTGSNPLYILTTIDDVNKPIYEQLTNRIKTLEIFSPLWDRADFESLFE